MNKISVENSISFWPTPGGVILLVEHADGADTDELVLQARASLAGRTCQGIICVPRGSWSAKTMRRILKVQK